MKKRTVRYFRIKKLVRYAAGLTGCIEFPFFGARYPDAACIDGWLCDLDSGEDGMVAYHEEHPCPVCRTREYIQVLLDNEDPLNRIRLHLNHIFNTYGQFNPTDHA